jgi:molybdate transport system substrate-binding protein
LNATKKEIQQRGASLIGFELGGKRNALEVGAGLYCILYQANAFEKDMLSLTHRANATETLYKRILPTGNFLYEHCAEYTTGYWSLSRLDAEEERHKVIRQVPHHRILQYGLLAIVALTLLMACSRQRPAKSEIIVGAASDLTPAFEELGRQFEQESGTHVTFSFGSTGTLARQIENGAPMDLFAAANVDYVDQLDREGLILPDTKTLYARGRITIWTRTESEPAITQIEDLARPDVARVAIANPEHAPYGKAAREALETAGVWKAVEPKLVYGENIRQAMQYAQTGNAEVAITALSLSVVSEGHWTLVPEELHKPLDQAMAVIKATRMEEESRRFAQFINSPQGRSTMRKYGFMLSGE